MSEKIAVLGGSFNPIHNGHLMLAEAAHDQYNINRILVMPNKNAYYKEEEFASDQARSDMVKLAIAPYSYMEFSDLELLREKITYTIDTIYELKRLFPDTEIYFIIGGDSLLSLKNWYRIDELLLHTHFLAARRDELDPYEMQKLIAEYQNHYPKCRIDILSTENADISSTGIRKMIQEGKDVSQLLPNEVFDYMISHDLYRT